MFLITFAIFLAGSWILVRNLHQDFKNLLISEQEMTKIVAFVLFWWLFGITFSPKNIFYLNIWLLAPILCCVFLLPVYLSLKRSRLKGEIKAYLDRLVLFLRAGEAARISLSSSVVGGSREFSKQVGLLLEAVSFSQHSQHISKDPMLLEFYEFIVSLSSETHDCLRKAECFRKKIETQLNYSRKVQKVTRTARTQAIIMSVLYLILLSFTLRQTSFAEIKELVLISVCLFSLGLFITLKIGRHHRWKI